VRRIFRYLPLLLVLFCCMQFASAQSSFDINVGFGAVQDKASSNGVDQNLQACALNSAGCTATPSLSSFMIGVGGDLMLWKKFGVGAEVNIQPGKQTYVDLSSSAASVGLSTLSLQSRVTLFDFNGIYEPVNTKKVALKLSGGIGGANIKFYESGSSSNSLVGSQNFSQLFGSSNHFQIHGGLGVQIYLTDHVFIRPQFDIHYVHNLTQFGSNLVKEETVWIGYSWGDRP
jgi:hypothetical protein